MSVQDRQLSFLKNLGYTGSVNDAYRAYLLAQLSPVTGSIDDLLRYFLRDRWGYRGSIDDMLREHLRYLGYTGSVTDMLYAAWGSAGIAGISFAADLKTTVVPNYGSGSATYTRATTATITDHEDVVRPVLSGEVRFQGARRVRNLVSATENISAAGGWTVAFGTCVAGVSDPVGGTAASTLTATSANAIAYQGFSGSSANTYITSIYIRRRTGTGVVNLVGPDGSSLVNITSALSTTTWKRFSIAGAGGATTFAHTAQVVTIGDAIDVWHPQCENVTGQSIQTPGEYVSVGVLSSPFHGAMVDGVKYFSTTNGNTVSSNVVTEASGSPISAATLKGYLAEGARTNLCLQSNAFTTTWTEFGTTTPTQNSVGPDGVSNSAWTLTDNDAGAVEILSQSITLTAATYTASVFVKKTTGAQASYPVIYAISGGDIAPVTVDTSNGIATAWSSYSGLTIASGFSAAIQNFSSGYWRVSLTFTGTAAIWAFRLLPAATTNPTQSTGTVDVAAQGSAVFYGAQVELGSFASSYIPTTTASVPRNADVLTYPSSGNITGTAGSFYAECSFNALYSYNTIAAGSTGSRYLISVDTNGAVFSYDGTTAPSQAFGVTANSLRKHAISWGSGRIYAYNGSTSTKAFDGNFDIGPAINVGFEAAATNPMFGTIRNVRIYSTQLSSTQLQTITT